jgi:tripartite-type tricarboxylate transporter receptor subunit TctC
MTSAPEEFAQFIKSEIPRWAKVIREQGVVIE